MSGTIMAGVRFATVDVEVDVLERLPVVLVDCRKPSQVS